VVQEQAEHGPPAHKLTHRHPPASLHPRQKVHQENKGGKNEAHSSAHLHCRQPCRRRMEPAARACNESEQSPHQISQDGRPDAHARDGRRKGPQIPEVIPEIIVSMQPNGQAGHPNRICWTQSQRRSTGVYRTGNVGGGEMMATSQSGRGHKQGHKQGVPVYRKAGRELGRLAQMNGNTAAGP
jgi:hypothetical protein